MRKWFTSLAVLGLASVATAQTIPIPGGSCGQSQSFGYDDGGPETSWKVSYPTLAGDAFNVDFNNEAATLNMDGIALNTFQNTSTGPLGIRYVALCADDLVTDSTGGTPLLASPLSILGSLSGTVTVTGNPNATAGYCPGNVGYDLPDVTIGSTGGAHAVMTFVTGDTGSWLCSDLSSDSGRSFFTANSYSSAAISLTGNLQMRLVGGWDTGTGSAYMSLNNSLGPLSLNQAAFVVATLWSNCVTQPTLYLQGAFVPFFIAAPQFVLSTGYENFSPISDLFQGTVCGNIDGCPPVGFVFDFGAFYIDNCDLKKNGNGKIKLTNLVNVTITPNSGVCNPCACFGRADDGSQDGTIWKVSYPSLSTDYFNMRQGSFVDPSGANCGTTVTDIQMLSWDFCGTANPGWGSVGLYPESSVVGSPTLASPVALATTLTFPPSASEFTYGTATVYDFPDVNTSTSAALAGLTSGHTAAQFLGGDTCVWQGSDTDGIDDDASGDCAAIPTSDAYFTLDAFSTPAVPWTSANWGQRVNWF